MVAAAVEPVVTELLAEEEHGDRTGGADRQGGDVVLRRPNLESVFLQLTGRDLRQ